jgi:hypothetical protein
LFAIEASYVEASWYDYRRACCKIKNCEIKSEIFWGLVPFMATPVACGVVFYLRGGRFFWGAVSKFKIQQSSVIAPEGGAIWGCGSCKIKNGGRDLDIPWGWFHRAVGVDFLASGCRIRDLGGEPGGSGGPSGELRPEGSHLRFE